MNYTLAQNHRAIRKKFTDKFIASFDEFCATHSDWISNLSIEFTEAYYDKMFMWDKLNCKGQQISFDDALEFLKDKQEDVFFLTETADCVTRDFCELSSQKEYAAIAAAAELAECIAYEWYTEYELIEQGYYLAAPILPSDLYVFSQTLSWCLILTHETDETGSADMRYCILIGEKTES